MYLHIGNFAPEKKTILEPTALYILEDSTHSEGQLTLVDVLKTTKANLK